MAVKRKSSPPPPPPRPRAPSPSSDEDSSSEEERDVALPSPSHAEIFRRRTEQHDDESDSDSGSESESDPEPPKANLNAPLKPSNSESSSDEEDEDEEESEGTEKLKSTVEESESKPDKNKKKLKLSGPDQSPSMKSPPAFLRIWSEEDAMALLRALSEYHASKGQLPQKKDYASFLSTISRSIGFPVTEKQLGNKIHELKRAYDKKIKKGSDVNISKPHHKAVFKMCAKLFDGSSSSKASNKKVKPEANGVAKMENVGAAHGHALGGAGNGGVADGAAMTRSYFYLRWFIKDLINGQQCPRGLLTIEEVIAQIGESRAKDLEANIKMLMIDSSKLRAREDKLTAELFGILADEMADD